MSHDDFIYFRGFCNILFLNLKNLRGQGHVGLLASNRGRWDFFGLRQGGTYFYHRKMIISAPLDVNYGTSLKLYDYEYLTMIYTTVDKTKCVQ